MSCKDLCVVFEWCAFIKLVLAEKLLFFRKKRVKFSKEELRDQILVTLYGMLSMGRDQIDISHNKDEIYLWCENCYFGVKAKLQMERCQDVCLH